MVNSETVELMNSKEDKEKKNLRDNKSPKRTKAGIRFLFKILKKKYTLKTMTRGIFQSTEKSIPSIGTGSKYNRIKKNI